MNNAIAQMLAGRAPAQRPQQNAIGNAVPQQMKAAMPRPQAPRATKWRSSSHQRNQVSSKQ